MSLPLAQEYYYEMGRLFYDRAEYTKAFERLEKACDLFIENKQFDRYVDTLNYVIRILVEKEEKEKIQAAKDRLQQVLSKENELSSRANYILGLCSFYRDTQEQAAMDYFQKALKQALEKDNKTDMCYALYGVANVYYATAKYNEALKELQNLEVFFQALNVYDLQISAKLLYGLIYRNRGEFDKALEYFWQAYELLRTNTNMQLYYNALYGLGSTYQRSGDSNLARLYLQLALKSIHEQELPRLAKILKNNLKELGDELQSGEYDLVFDPNNNSVTERNLGRIDFKNQFILIDLLHLFLRNPGKVFPKEALVKKVWDQEYDPTVHDNKIYVTIKRLRQLIEPDFNKPKYIFRGKNGYYLNKTARIYVGH